MKNTNTYPENFIDAIVKNYNSFMNSTNTQHEVLPLCKFSNVDKVLQKHFKEKEVKLINLLYKEGNTVIEVADKLTLSRSRVYQIKLNILSKFIRYREELYPIEGELLNAILKEKFNVQYDLNEDTIEKYSEFLKKMSDEEKEIVIQKYLNNKSLIEIGQSMYGNTLRAKTVYVHHKHVITHIKELI